MGNSSYHKIIFLDLRLHQNTYYSIGNSGLYVKVSIQKNETVLADQVMKSDHWHGIHILSSEFPPIEGAPNFRKITRSNLFGTGQPTTRKKCQQLSPLMRTQQMVWK
jgi:hypothetical protein